MSLLDAMKVDKLAKSEQLQIRLSRQEKAAIQRAAARAGMDMSGYVLSRVLSAPAAQFRACVEQGVRAQSPRFALAELNSLLAAFSAGELREAIAVPPPPGLTPFVLNYITAMVEYACARRSVALPGWTRAVTPLPDPVFGTALQSLRLHMLTHSPPPFRARNIFIEATVGERI
jgi:mobilization protein NikA